MCKSLEEKVSMRFRKDLLKNFDHRMITAPSSFVTFTLLPFNLLKKLTSLLCLNLNLPWKEIRFWPVKGLGLMRADKRFSVNVVTRHRLQCRKVQKQQPHEPKRFYYVKLTTKVQARYQNFAKGGLNKKIRCFHSKYISVVRCAEQTWLKWFNLKSIIDEV